MIDFSCPCCRTVYHADESQIGKQVRCTHRGCNEVITIDRQDGQYRYSAQQVQTATRRQSAVVTPGEGQVGTPFSRRSKWRFPTSVGVVVVLILTIGVGGYYLGARQQHTKAKSDAVVNLSPDEVEVANNPHSD